MVAISEARRVVLIRTDRLGETLLTLPVVAVLKAACPRTSLTLVAHPTLVPLLEAAPGVDQVLPYQPTAHAWWVRALQTARVLRSHRFDLALVSHPKKELHVAVWLAGIPIRVGYGRKWGWCLTHRVADRKALGERHEVEYNLDLLRALGVPTTVPPWQLPRFEREQTDVLQLLDQHGIPPTQPFLAIHPWSSAHAKEWPIERFRALIRLLVQRLPLRIILIGGPDEQARAKAFVAPDLPVVDLVGRLSLRQLAALLQRARLLVSNDSGPVHLASAVKTKTVVLFGAVSAATGPRRWGPWGEGHVVIWKPSMDAITVEEVFGAVCDMLKPPRVERRA